jgi:hypothetical protein
MFRLYTICLSCLPPSQCNIKREQWKCTQKQLFVFRIFSMWVEYFCHINI